jgi:phosphoribosyl 1,2-cyclic phosphodiesterase
MSTVYARVWGSRGSIPCPGPETVQFGGNTSCIELRFDDRLVIVDAGSGIRQLGDFMMKNDIRRGPIDTDIFITHTHWDHIMGFPIFTPIYVPGTKLRIHGPITYEEDTLDKIIGSQLSYRYWPVRQDELSAQIEYDHLKEGVVDLGRGLTLTAKYLNHPILCMGYRFDYKGVSIATCYDHEPFRNVFPTDPADPGYDQAAAEEGEQVAREENEKILRYYQGADILIHDCQYTTKEYKVNKIGWGHSTYEYAINAANKAGVKRLVMTHHDPNRSDVELTEFELRYQAVVEGRVKLKVQMAREGETLYLLGGADKK